VKSRLTDVRREILKVIESAEKPLNVKIIEHRLTSHPNLSTIYRALDFLEAEKLIRSVSFSGVKFYFTSKRGNGHFLVCKECHEILEFRECVVKNLQKKIQEKYDYEITDHILYFQGLCLECQHYLNKKKRIRS
jgi:Fur family ferric uptake transcriptional regulator